MKPKLFGSSGIRGLVNVKLTPILAVRTSMAVAAFSKAKKAVVARDTRVSGLMLENALVSGFLAAGVETTCLGVLPTPALAFLTKILKNDVGVMITASHNPPQYNGIKIFDRNSMAYGEKSQSEVEKLIENRKFNLIEWQHVGKATHIDQSHSYVEMIEKEATLTKKWHVVIDSGCGATYDLAPRVFKNLGCRVTAINAHPDGYFPARSPEPTADSLKSLANLVRELDADAGMAYDGDGDRVAFIDERGEFADFDRILAAYSSHISKKERGATIVTNVEASMCIEKMVETHDGKVVRTKVGDVYLSEAMKSSRVVFGGEPCGAWIHPQVHYCPDGILSSVLLLKALEDEKTKLSEFVSRTPNYPTLRENVACKNEDKSKIMKKAEEDLIHAFAKHEKFTSVDGVRLSIQNGWILVRASGTEPLIRLTVEGESLKAAREIMREGISIIKRLVR